jgi:hypothetical protein
LPVPVNNPGRFPIPNVKSDPGAGLATGAARQRH